MALRTLFAFFLSTLTLGLASCGLSTKGGGIDQTDKSPQEIANVLLDTARDAIISIAEDQQIGTLFLKQLRDPNVAGIIIVPNLIKGGIFLGGSGGSGVLLAKAANGEWSYPAFIRQGSGSFGLQFGFQSAKVASLITSIEQLKTMLKGTPVFGGEVGGSVVDEGAGIDYSGGLDIASILTSFAVTRGAYIGADIKLGGLWSDAGLNHAFYNDPTTTPEAIVIEARYANSSADSLRNTLMQYQSP